MESHGILEKNCENPEFHKKGRVGAPLNPNSDWIAHNRPFTNKKVSMLHNITHLRHFVSKHSQGNPESTQMHSAAFLH